MYIYVFDVFLAFLFRVNFLDFRMAFLYVCLWMFLYILNVCECNYFNKTEFNMTIKYYESLWLSYKITSYSMIFEWECDCEACKIANKNIEVINDEIKKIEFSNNDDDQECDIDFTEYKTMQELFDFLKTHLVVSKSMDVSFDDKYGYPTKAFIQNPSAYHEVGWHISCIYTPQYFKEYNECSEIIVDRKVYYNII